MNFLVRLGLNFHPMGEIGGRVGGEVDWAGDNFFFTDRNVTILKSRLAARERCD